MDWACLKFMLLAAADKSDAPDPHPFCRMTCKHEDEFDGRGSEPEHPILDAIETIDAMGDEAWPDELIIPFAYHHVKKTFIQLEIVFV
jgi:hypothetical protein